MRLVLATHNPGKLTELRVLLRPMAIELVEAGALGLAVPDETGEGYVENATIKAIAAATASGAAALGDDVGLAVAVLGGAPGIHTARYTEQHGGVAAACAELAAQTGLLATPTPEVRAALCCALVLADADGVVAVAESEIPGRLRWPPGDAPGLAAMFEPDPPHVLVDGGALVHRRVAFERLVPALRTALEARGQ
jgi:XTP/dITP diphosphohydrolase